MKVGSSSLGRDTALIPVQIYRPPPFLGQHTDEVLGELGYGDVEIEKMKQDGIV
jgi:crotonobetainyl-CoA:carnitine CoA-transferase CaiB-like acyl-CoA transferase